jgi:hypothetical protein
MVWRCVRRGPGGSRRGPGGSSEPPEPPICFSLRRRRGGCLSHRPLCRRDRTGSTAACSPGLSLRPARHKPAALTAEVRTLGAESAMVVRTTVGSAPDCPGRKSPFWCLSALRAHTKPPYKTDLYRKTLRLPCLTAPGGLRQLKRAELRRRALRRCLFSTTFSIPILCGTKQVTCAGGQRTRMEELYHLHIRGGRTQRTRSTVRSLLTVWRMVLAGIPGAVIPTMAPRSIHPWHNPRRRA